MNIQWNSEPELNEEIVEVRKDQEGKVYLANDQDFEFTLSKDLVDQIKAL